MDEISKFISFFLRVSSTVLKLNHLTKPTMFLFYEFTWENL